MSLISALSLACELGFDTNNESFTILPASAAATILEENRAYHIVGFSRAMSDVCEPLLRQHHSSWKIHHFRHAASPSASASVLN